MAYNDIVAIHENKVQQYISEMEMFDLSFVEHPMERIADKLAVISNTKDGRIVVTAGIIKDIIKRKTKTNKPFYKLILIAPRETVNVTVWSDIYNANRDMIAVGNLVKVRGRVGYGGITMDNIAVPKKRR